MGCDEITFIVKREELVTITLIWGGMTKLKENKGNNRIKCMT